jgi:hypothetical protein
MSSSEMLRRVALVRIDLSEELIASETWVSTRATRRNNPEDGTLYVLASLAKIIILCFEC